MNTLNELKQSILADGTIDAAEVQQLQTAILADGRVDRQEANLLFELNDATAGKDNCPEWASLFISGISSHLLDDETTPGEIDEDEARWLLSKIQSDGTVDALERALLQHLKARAKTFPAMLDI